MFGKFEKRMSGTQMIALGFLLLIFIGTILLMLPVSSRNGEWTPFITALFTSTSGSG
jgi:trk system potassium uptake protein TrkH